MMPLNPDQQGLPSEPNRSAPAIVLVTGATGAIGPLVVAQLAQAGYQIRVLTRHQPKIGVLPSGVEVQIGDITDPTAVDQAIAGCQKVVHMAALLHVVNPSPTMRPVYEQVNVQGTAHVVQAALRHAVDRLLYFSTIAVYGYSRGQILNEASVPQPDTLYGQTKLAAEELVLQAQRSDGQALGTVLRLAAVYGARVKGNYQRLLTALARGRFVAIGRGHNRRTLIHERDVANAALLALQHPTAAGQVYNLTDGNFHQLSEILAAMSLALGRRPPRFALPVGPVRWTIRWLEKNLSRIGQRSPVGCATIDKYIEDVAVEGQRIQCELGFRSQFDLQSGWQDAVATQRGNGGYHFRFDE